MNKNSKFCALAWSHRFVNIQGEIQVCCTGEAYGNEILHDNGRPMNASEGLSNEKIMNSSFMKDLRVSMLQGQWPSFCERCKTSEETGGHSRRTIENEAIKDRVPTFLKQTERDGHINELAIHSLDLRLGNHCNLACRMCYAYSSDKWAKEWGDLANHKQKATTKISPWYSSSEFGSYLKESIPHLTRLHFAGGEPFLSKEMHAFLRLCILENKAKDIEIAYNTNLTLIPEELKTLWPHFKGVKILVSIDAYGELNDYIRYQSSWDTIHKNLQFLENNFDVLNLKEVLVSCTVQLYNVLRLPALYNYLYENYKKVIPIPQLIDLYAPLHYSTQVLPEQYKELADDDMKNLIETSKNRIDPLYHYLLEDLKRSRTYMNAEDHSARLKTFLNACISKDLAKNTNFFAHVSEFKFLID